MRHANASQKFFRSTCTLTPVRTLLQAYEIASLYCTSIQEALNRKRMRSVPLKDCVFPFRAKQKLILTTG
uniref:AlNc14C439G11652 protein n=1 Tax=Albugo laibachii Nc14 TaxID=890382 RepID=F0WZR1_9STRA|nr:AlNc14C439G11652 [Albugo laibachii Nc14]|eukprot:CCA26988.1 AlNc14C439G11652 [Albugo laibachii Nc14]